MDAHAHEAEPVSEVAARDAAAAGLLYVEDFSRGYTRRRKGDAFSYFRTDGTRIKEVATLARIKRIGVPPAWTDVWIAPSAHSHIQAIGRDARGRKQYRYHAEFRALRDGNKFHHVTTFAAALPKLRRRIDRDLRRTGLPHDKVLAAVVALLDRTLLRVGNAEYARQNGSFGLTTLRDQHAEIAGDSLRFHFMGKSGKRWSLRLHDRRLARIVKSCQDIPGQHLFQYLDAAGARKSIGSADVNRYLREVTGADVTAKDFRTWGATLLAAMALTRYPPFDTLTLAKANIREAIELVATELGNTPTVCRKCYVHPAVTEGYLEGSLARAMAHPPRGRRYFEGVEAAVLAYLARSPRQHPGAANPTVKKMTGRRNRPGR